jgi:hypothetical protein
VILALSSSADDHRYDTCTSHADRGRFLEAIGDNDQVPHGLKYPKNQCSTLRLPSCEILTPYHWALSCFHRSLSHCGIVDALTSVNGRQGESLLGLAMNNHRRLDKRILNVVQCESLCELDELILLCGDFPWYEVWCEIVHLLQVGVITVTVVGGKYIVRSPSQGQESGTVRRKRLRPRGHLR